VAAVTETGGRWQDFFSDPAYVRFASQILDPDRTASEVAGLRRLLHLEAGTRVLDLGCGYGRISLPLARLGCAVVGLDGSPVQLELARAAASEHGLDIELLECDMRDLDLERRFDVVLSLGTALGYAADEADDASALRAAARALVSGGRLVLDTENRETKLRMAPRVWFDMNGPTVWCARRYDHLTGRWHERISWPGEDGEVAGAEYSVRLYTVAELRQLLEAAGLVVDSVFGDLGGSAFHPDAERTVVCASKP
jgi:SAM-dependent methyltransferase